MFTKNKLIVDNDDGNLSVAETRNESKNTDIDREWREMKDNMLKNREAESSFRRMNELFYLSYDDFETIPKRKTR